MLKVESKLQNNFRNYQKYIILKLLKILKRIKTVPEWKTLQNVIIFIFKVIGNFMYANYYIENYKCKNLIKILNMYACLQHTCFIHE